MIERSRQGPSQATSQGTAQGTAQGRAQAAQAKRRGAHDGSDHEADSLTPRQRQVLEFIDAEVRRRGYPPSVREIGEAVGLSSSSTVHAHLAALQDKGYLRRDPTKPRAIEITLEPDSGLAVERRPVRHVPLVGDVAAGTGVLAAENIEEMVPLPQDFTGEGQLFMLRVRGDSMIDAGILDRDYVVVRRQDTADNGDVVVAGIPGDEATVKTFVRRKGRIVLRPENPHLDEMIFEPADVAVYGKVVTVLRRL
jgi:repressor LexA